MTFVSILPRLCCMKIYSKISNTLYFNFMITFALESFYEAFLVLILNLKDVSIDI